MRNYSGFNKSDWKPRSNIMHWKDVEYTVKCSTKNERQKMESELGCRYSVLLKLPYFDPVRMLILDPMHNLYLAIGTAKHVFHKFWMVRMAKDKTALSKVKASLGEPSSVHFSRIPSPTDHPLTAEQWVSYYSVYCMHDILSDDELECWRAFVLASRLLS